MSSAELMLQGGFQLLAIQHGSTVAAAHGFNEWPWDTMLSWQGL